MNRFAFLFVLLGSFGFVGCAGEPPEDAYSEQIKFLDSPEWKLQPEVALADLAFTDAQGKAVDLKPYLGKQNLVLVMTRGYSHEGPYGGAICLYCATQTSRLIANYPKFKERNAEVLVVFPIAKMEDKGELESFTATAKRRMAKPVEEVPFPVWLDEELKAVNHLGIKADLSKPSTYILDKTGKVRFAYVGNSLTDRPSVKAVVAKLDEINGTP